MGADDKINLNAPWRGAKDGYLQHYFITRENMSRILMNVTSYCDPRIPLMTEFFISGITDDKCRELLFSRKESKYQEYLEEISDPGSDDLAYAMSKACLRVLGDITAWYDEFLGITNTQTFDVIRSQEGEEECDYDCESDYDCASVIAHGDQDD
jgi:hypothetical protein